METKDVLQLVGMLIGSGMAFAGFGKWVLTRIDDVRKEAKEGVKEAHRRVDDMAREFVRHDNLLPHLKRIEDGQQATNTRIDNLLALFAKHITKED